VLEHDARALADYLTAIFPLDVSVAEVRFSRDPVAGTDAFSSWCAIISHGADQVIIERATVPVARWEAWKASREQQAADRGPAPSAYQADMAAQRERQRREFAVPKANTDAYAMAEIPPAAAGTASTPIAPDADTLRRAAAQIARARAQPNHAPSASDTRETEQGGGNDEQEEE
jgi:hypothetical protein